MFQLGNAGASRLVAQLPYWDMPNVKDFDIYFDAMRGGYKNQLSWGNLLSNLITDTHAQIIAQPDGIGGWNNVAPNVTPLGPLGLQVTPNRTNSIRNSSGAGAVVGTPGTMPTNWTRYMSPSAIGTVQTNIVGTGTEFGLPYVDLQIVGSPVGAGGYDTIFDTNSAIAATQGQIWAGTCGLRLVGGSLTGVSSTQLYLTEWTSAGGILGGGQITTATLSSAYQLAYVSRTVAGATAAYIRPHLSFNLTGVPVDFTVRVYNPQLELGEFYSPPISTSGTAVTRTGNRPIFNVSGKLDSGFGFVFKFDYPFVNTDNSTRRLFVASDSTANNRIFAFRVASSTSISIGGTAAGVATTNNPTALANAHIAGKGVIYGAIGPGYARLGRIGVGDTNQTAPTNYPIGMTQIAILGNGYNPTENTYGFSEKVGLKYGAANDALFQQMKTIAATL